MIPGSQMSRFQPRSNSSKARTWGCLFLGGTATSKSRPARQRGFSMIEVTVILVTAAILSSVLVASVSSTLNSGRIARTQADQLNVTIAYNKFTLDTSLTGFNVNGTEVTLLVGSGDIPGLLSAPLGDEATWLGVVNNSSIDTMERHLSINNPGGGFPYSAGAGGWRGAYLQAPVEADPWGNRYAVNAEYFDGNPVASDVVVISAGPNETIETVFTGSLGITAGGDDIITAF